MEAVMGEESFGTLVDKLREADPETWEETKLDARDEIGEVFGEGVLEPVGAAETSEAAATRAEDNGVLVNLLLRSRDARQNLQRILQSDQSLLQKARDGVRNLFAVLPGVKNAKAKGMERLRAAPLKAWPARCGAGRGGRGSRADDCRRSLRCHAGRVPDARADPCAAEACR